MPIEPSSVSNHSVREVEKASSGRGPWTSMQGSSTGGKDRPLNSIWEKAIAGAQKLFGLDSSESQSAADRKDSEESAQQGEGREPTDAFSGPPGFSGRGFGAFGGTALGFGSNAFASVSSSRSSAAPETSASMPKERPEATPRIAEKRVDVHSERAPARETPVKQKPEAERDETREAKEKSSSKSESRPGPLSPSSGREGIAGPVTTKSGEQVAPAPTTAAGQPASTSPTVLAAGPAATPPSASDSRAAPAPAINAGSELRGAGAATGKSTSSSQPVSQGSRAELASNGSSTAKAAAAVTALNDSKSASPTDSSLEGVKSAKADNAVAKPVSTPGSGASIEKPDTPVGASTAAGASGSEAKALADKAIKPESLGFDASKAKESVSEAMARSTGRASTSQPVQTPVASTAQGAATVAGVVSDGRESVAKPMASVENGSMKAMDVSADAAEAGKKDTVLPALNRTAANRSTAAGEAPVANRPAEAIDPALAGTKSTATGSQTGASAGLTGREAAAAASRIQSPMTPNRPAMQNQSAPQSSLTGLSGVTGAATADGPSGLAQGARQGGAHQQDADGAGKQDFAAAMKQAGSKAGEKAGGEAGQSFDVKAEAGSRRSEAAAKAKQSSYVSKTAAELKEVVATLTKSIDRLVSNRPGQMNMKINFEQGGSLTLRISMDGGQVSTSMQTDVAGLETAIKAHWSELSNDWSQKGVKLSAPQFQNSVDGGERFENLNEFAQRQDRNGASRQMTDGRQGGNSGRGQPGAAGSDGESATGGDSAETAASAQEPAAVVSDRELKAYA